MATLTKLQVWTNVQKEVTELLETSKTSKKFSEALLNILESNIAPKSGGNSLYPPKLDDNGVIVEAYCRFHQRYEIIEDMVVSKDKSKGYCKASISLWNKTSSNIKKLDSKAVDAMSEADFDKAQEYAKESKTLKELLNKPEHYDYDRDWANFNGVVESE